MAVAISIVEKHHGSIQISSEPGTGTTVTILLPASKKRLQAALSQSTIVRNSTGRVLVMDDEATVRETVANMLKALGYQVDTAENGEAVITAYRRARDAGRPYAVIILDLTVPGGMGGEETLKQLMKIDERVCAIVSSGYSDDPVMSEYRRFGFQGILQKPYKLNDLDRTIRKHLST